MKLPQLTTPRTSSAHRYVAVERRPDARRARLLAQLQERYVDGELTLAEYEAETEHLLHAEQTADQADTPLRLRPRPGRGLGVALGAGATLLLTTGLLLARALRRPSLATHSSRSASQTVLVVELFSARW